MTVKLRESFQFLVSVLAHTQKVEKMFALKMILMIKCLNILGHSEHMFAVIYTSCPPPSEVTTCSAFLGYPFIKGDEWELVEL